jgi:hypothetical protein
LRVAPVLTGRSNPLMTLPRSILACLCCAALSAGEARNVILFIGDGMNVSSEIAASRYLHGQDRALSFHAFGYQTHVTTWDVTTDNAFAKAAGKPAFSEGAFVVVKSLSLISPSNSP